MSNGGTLRKRYDAKLLKAALEESDSEQEQRALSYLLVADDSKAWQESDLDFGGAILWWQSRVVSCVRNGLLSDLSLFPEHVLKNESPQDDPRRKLLAHGTSWLTNLAAAGLVRLPPNPDQQAAAFQVVNRPSFTEARINSEIRGTLVAMVWPHPTATSTHRMELTWVMPPGERDQTTFVTVINGTVGQSPGHLVFGDTLPSVIRTASRPRLRSLLNNSLGVPGSRARWRGIRGRIKGDEIRTAIYEATQSGAHPEELGSRVVDLLEQSHRAGMPSRRMASEFVSLDAPTDDGAPLELPALVSQDADEQIDLNEARSELSQKDQEILRLFFEGYPEKEIAGRLGVTQQAVSKRLLKATATLKKKLSS